MLHKWAWAAVLLAGSASAQDRVRLHVGVTAASHDELKHFEAIHKIKSAPDLSDVVVALRTASPDWLLDPKGTTQTLMGELIEKSKTFSPDTLKFYEEKMGPDSQRALAQVLNGKHATPEDFALGLDGITRNYPLTSGAYGALMALVMEMEDRAQWSLAQIYNDLLAKYPQTASSREWIKAHATELETKATPYHEHKYIVELPHDSVEWELYQNAWGQLGSSYSAPPLLANFLEAGELAVISRVGSYKSSVLEGLADLGRKADALNVDILDSGPEWTHPIVAENLAKAYTGDTAGLLKRVSRVRNWRQRQQIMAAVARQIDPTVPTHSEDVLRYLVKSTENWKADDHATFRQLVKFYADSADDPESGNSGAHVVDTLADHVESHPDQQGRYFEVISRIADFPEKRARVSLADKLGKFQGGHPGYIKIVDKLSQDKEEMVRSAAFGSVLDYIRDYPEESFVIMERAIFDNGLGNRNRALQYLHMYGNPGDSDRIFALFERIAAHPDKSLLAFSIERIGMYDVDKHKAFDFYLRFVDAGDRDVALHALEGVFWFVHREPELKFDLSPVIEKARKHPDGGVRQKLVFLIGGNPDADGLKNFDAVAFLNEMTQDEDPKVVALAKQTLSQLADYRDDRRYKP